MRRLTWGASLVAGAWVVAAMGAWAQAPVASQAPAESKPAPTKSVYGKLLSVDKALNNVLMTEDGGAQLAWRFDAAVIAEAARFKAGDPLIVIYRQIGPGAKDKRVTAIAFPGSARSPIYVNMTGDRVALRSAAGVDGKCNATTGPCWTPAGAALRSAKPARRGRGPGKDGHSWRSALGSPRGCGGRDAPCD